MFTCAFWNFSQLTSATFLEFAEEVLDQMAPFVHFGIERDGLGATRVLRNDDLGTAFVEIGDDVVAVDGLVGEQRAEFDTLNERSHPRCCRSGCRASTESAQKQSFDDHYANVAIWSRFAVSANPRRGLPC